jgi:hypothetical protein
VLGGQLATRLRRAGYEVSWWQEGKRIGVGLPD